MEFYMSLNKLETKKVEKLIGDYCNNRIPPHVRDQIQLVYNIHGNGVKIIEKRPHWQNKDHWTESPIARIKFDPETFTWELFWRRANGRWERYPDFKPVNDLKKIIDEIDSDPYHVFWG
jgi:hypothetical protein